MDIEFLSRRNMKLLSRFVNQFNDCHVMLSLFRLKKTVQISYNHCMQTVYNNDSIQGAYKLYTI